MYNNSTMIINHLYGMSPPSPDLAKIRDDKVKAMIASMGDKYLLAIPVEKKTK